MNKQFNEILLKKLNIDEYIKLFHIIEGKKKEAQKELLEEFQKEMYEQNVSYICDFEIQHKLEELTKENIKK